MASYDVPLKETLEKAGYKVTWQGKGQPIKVEKDGLTFDIKPGDYVLKGDKAYLSSAALPSLMQNAGYQWVREALPAGAGYEYKFDPKTRQTTVSHPFGGSYTFTNTILAGGRTYASPSELETAKKVAGPAYEAGLTELASLADKYFQQEQQKQAQYFAQQEQLLKNYLDQVNNFTKQYGEAALAMLNAYQQHYHQALQQLQQLMQPDTRVPETVKLALSMLDKSLQENLQQLAEEMNRRGIYQSGLAMDMERRMREGALTEKEKILAQWLDEAHRRAYDAALRYADYLTRYAEGLTGVYQAAQLEPLKLAQLAAEQAYKLTSGLAESRYQAEAGLREKAFDVLSRLREMGMNFAQNAATLLQQRRWALEDWARERQAAREDWERQRQAEREDWERRAALERELLDKRLRAQRELAQMQQQQSQGSAIDPLMSMLLQLLSEPTE